MLMRILMTPPGLVYLMAVFTDRHPRAAKAIAGLVFAVLLFVAAYLLF